MDGISTKDELSKISDVLGNLSHFNLEKLICTPLTHATSTGGSSDTYTSTFTEKMIQDALVSSSCFVCRGSKESHSSEMTCRRCKYIWGGKLGIKQFRKRIKDRDQWKSTRP
ncbi:hypothetical protein SCHPADRAFT_711365 [Schizopora paradoxa]|uniref:Uncharacterized protein n=1 Tax=Schizopora paradoxa TaxID=27342 RepID=A0A0H2R204_9AGAM|nr:hypothetical protein SCHPADRAFT_711365 [Schizopora paradoxa]